MKPNRLIPALTLVALCIATAAVAGPDKGAPTEPKLVPSSVVQPMYPEKERQEGVEGAVILAVDIDATGAVAGAKVDKAVDGHPAFTDAAIAAVKQWRFEPARQDGKPVAIQVKIPVKFALNKSGK